MRLEFLPWVILFLPLAAAGGITLFTLPDHARSARLSIGAVLASFALSVVFVAVNGLHLDTEARLTWVAVGDLQVDLGLRLDVLSLLMLLVVTGVGSAIHVYSKGYMRDETGQSRYFAGLSLFTFAMLTIVLANNFVMLFIGWELVGLSSYLLIGFWFDKPSAADAGKKAFLTNRLGDFGFLLGILLVWAALGSLHFGTLEQRLTHTPGAFGPLATAAGLLVFCGAVGKSAQFPLHVWLPDAMEGPTPVSALIHAATMVAAGVYLLCRVFFLLDLPGSHALAVIAWVGGITALLAGLMAIQQDDIKRILAYSTLSQLGYMVLAVGVAAPTPAMYHLTTHAFFKALLFLGAGSAICALHHEQNIWKMGGLLWRMPITGVTFILATLALCGVPPFSGFFSKDEIIAATLTGPHGHPALFALAVAVAVLTTLYMFRLVIVAVLGLPRTEAARQAKESPRVMTVPLLALAVPSVLAGFWSIPQAYAAQLGPSESGHASLAMTASLAAVVLGLLVAVRIYGGAAADPLPGRLGAVATLLRQRFYLDELYAATVIRWNDLLATVADLVDRWVIAGVGVRGVHGTTEFVGRVLRLAQSGNLHTYAVLLVLGVALVIYLVLGR